MRIKTTVFLGLFLLAAIGFAGPALAADNPTWSCCDSPSNPQLCQDPVKYCADFGGTICKFPTGCSGKSGCGSYSVPICCCNMGIYNPVSSKSASTSKPEFTPPDLQIDIPGLNLIAKDVDCSLVDGNYICRIPWLGQYITAIYKYGLSVVSILAAIVLMAGGVMWLISRGDASRVTQAKEMIIGSVTGLIILVGSYVLLVQINPELVNFNPITLGYINPEEPAGDITVDQKGLVTRKGTHYIIIHTAAALATRDNVDKYHRKKGWNGIGYNFYIERDGTFVNGRGENAVGAHSIKYNSDSIGISYSGCYKKEQHSNKTVADAIKNDTITQAQFDTLIEKIKYYQAKYHIPRENVLGHYEEPVSKACPCLPMNEVRKRINP